MFDGGRFKKGMAYVQEEIIFLVCVLAGMVMEGERYLNINELCHIVRNICNLICSLNS